ncbi:MAG: hypothetical protein RBR78_02625 [Flavobacteriaceae bacterium]|jgi:hypothetical protein|nr:hypothetical protein [Flavobacteriaceae bacterium]
MKINLKSILVITLFITAFAVNAQSSDSITEKETGLLVDSMQDFDITKSENEISSINIINWFVGAKQNSNLSLSDKEGNKEGQSAVISKKEQYLQSGLSNKTLLIRSIMKKADSYTNATV